MTTFLQIPAPMARLFTRIDAAGATDPLLRQVLDHWRTGRGRHIAPSRQDIPDLPAELATITFLAVPDRNEDWRLDRVGAEAADILTSGMAGTLLSTLGNRRIAVRLRRLLRLVSQTEEPVSVLFDAVERGEPFETEILAAPLAGDRRAKTLLCALTRRKRATSALH